MILMTATLIIGAFLSVMVVLDALRPAQESHPFAAPRRQPSTRILDTVRLESLRLPKSLSLRS